MWSHRDPRQSIRLIAVRLTQGVGWAAAYASWMVVFRLLVLTFITYFLNSSSRTPRFEDISESFSANELSFLGLGAALFVGLLRALYPITSTTTADIFTPARLEKNVLPGFAHGAVLATGVTLAFVLSGTYRYLGFFIQFEEAPLVVMAVLVRMLAVGAFCYFEEFLFRGRITQDLREMYFGKKRGGFNEEITVGLSVAVLYCGVKWIQFDIGLTQLLTLFLVSIALSVKTYRDGGDFGRGAGFWAAILVVFQPLFSLPIFGNDFSGLLLIKYQPNEPGTDQLTRWLSGGPGGPLSSIALQILLIVDIVRGLLQQKKRLS